MQEYNTNTTSNQNKQQRDYDKKPIVIKNPYEFFLSNLFFFSHCGTILILLVYADYMGIVNINNIFLWAFFWSWRFAYRSYILLLYHQKQMRNQIYK